MEYEAKIIDEFATRLYKKANSIVITYTVLGALIGLGAGYPLGHGIGAIIGLVIVGAIGYVLGTERAFHIKLQAQTALCQAQIEKNTKALLSTS